MINSPIGPRSNNPVDRRYQAKETNHSRIDNLFREIEKVNLLLSKANDNQRQLEHLCH